jgi:hypothetical protein
MFGEPRRASSDWEIGFVPRAPLCGLHGSDERIPLCRPSASTASVLASVLVADVGVGTM